MKKHVEQVKKLFRSEKATSDIEIDIIRMFLYQEKARAASVLDVPEEPDVEVVDLPFQFFLFLYQDRDPPANPAPISFFTAVKYVFHSHCN